MNESAIVKQIYNEVYFRINEPEFKYTWCYRLMKLLKTIDLEELWINQKNINPRLTKIEIKKQTK